MHDLDRFVAAQAGIYEDVLDELRRGRKETHWMWFIFPQIAGLGHSAMSRRFSINSLDDARAFLAHPVLGVRLRECCAILLAGGDRTADEIFGPLDAMKLRSCLTLFSRADPEEAILVKVLARFFGGIADQATLDLLSSPGTTRPGR